MNLTLEVHKASWYMIHYGGPTPKRHYAFSNSRHVASLNAGKLKGWAKKKRVLKAQGKHRELVQKYQDSRGQRRWKGTKALRSSEFRAKPSLSKQCKNRLWKKHFFALFI